jgi:ferric-chelate reductase
MHVAVILSCCFSFSRESSSRIPLPVIGIMRGPLWLFLYLYVLVAAASVIPQNQRCVTAVYTAYGYISFSGTHAKGSWNTRCQNSLEVTSIYAASDRYCSVPERQAGLSELEALCRQYAGVGLIPRERLAENLTDDAVRNMRVVEYLELSRRKPIASPVLISPAYYEVTFRTIVSSCREKGSQGADRHP